MCFFCHRPTRTAAQNVAYQIRSSIAVNRHFGGKSVARFLFCLPWTSDTAMLCSIDSGVGGWQEPRAVLPLCGVCTGIFRQKEGGLQCRHLLLFLLPPPPLCTYQA